MKQTRRDGPVHTRAFSYVEVAVEPGRLCVFERSGEGACPRLEEKLRRLGLRLAVRRIGPCG